MTANDWGHDVPRGVDSAAIKNLGATFAVFPPMAVDRIMELVSGLLPRTP